MKLTSILIFTNSCSNVTEIFCKPCNISECYIHYSSANVWVCLCFYRISLTRALLLIQIILIDICSQLGAGIVQSV
jgi:hypothetical protein